MTRALVVQHVAIEGPYAIADALRRGDVTIDVRLAGSDPLPASIDGFDALVVMGGPMSAYDDHDFPTRRDELTLLASAVAAGVPTLGVCLGAQLLAAAVGGAAVPGEAGLEIGWGPVWLVPEAKDDPLLADLDGELTVLHWHGDTVVLPSDAVLLASSDRYANQAFRVAPRAWASSSTSRSPSPRWWATSRRSGATRPSPSRRRATSPHSSTRATRSSTASRRW